MSFRSAATRDIPTPPCVGSQAGRTPRRLQALRTAALATCAAVLMPILAHAATPPRTAPADLGFDPERLTRLDGMLQGYVDRGELPGVSLLVARHGQIAYLQSFGWRDLASQAPMQDDTLVRIYSMAKPITAAAVMAAHEDGGFALDEPIARHVPEFAHPMVYAGGEGDTLRTVPAEHPITVEQLMLHTAGLTMSFQIGTPVAKLYTEAGLTSARWFLDPNIPDLGAFAARLGALPLAYPPGERWHYGLGLDIAALVIERTQGKRFDEYLRTRLLEPLGMHDTGFFVPETERDRFASLYARGRDGALVEVEPAGKSPFLAPPVVATGSGALVSTLLDYFRFAQMLCNDGELDGVRVLSPASVDRMLRNHLRPDQFGQLAEATPFGFGGTGTGTGYGYGGAVVIDKDQAGGLGSNGEYKWGGAASTTFLVDRAQGVVAVLMTQLTPSGTYPLGDQMKTLIYEALTDPSR